MDGFNFGIKNGLYNTYLSFVAGLDGFTVGIRVHIIHTWVLCQDWTSLLLI